MSLLPRPDLNIADEELLAAQAIARTTGGLTVELIDSYVATLREMRKIVEAGNLVPVCPELTNANPSAPHTVILETQAWLLAQMAYRINQIPEQNLIEFARLFGIELRAASKARTILRFTTANATGNVTVPIGTQVSTEDGEIVFETVETLIIPQNAPSGSVTAQCLDAGHLLLAPNKLTRIIDSIASVNAVTNLSAIDSGTATETVESALERMRRYQRRGERIVSGKDLEEAILDALEGNGVVRVFPFVVNGQFQAQPDALGHTTIIVMTRTGDPIDMLSMAKVNKILLEVVGNQFVYIVNPSFVNFNVEASIKINTGSPQTEVVAAVTNNLRNFYSPSRELFGRPILRSEIIAVIEGTPGVDRIVAPLNSSAILAQPLTDTKLLQHQLPKLVNVTIQVV